MVQRCWVSFQCRGFLLIWIRVGQGPTALAVGAGWELLRHFSLVYHFSFLSPSLWETISIFHGCMVWIEKSVARVTDRHHVACRVMPNSDPE